MRRGIISPVAVLLTLSGIPSRTVFADTTPPLELVLCLDVSDVLVGDVVRLREMVAESTDVQFSGVEHEAMVIGRCDGVNGRVTHLKPGEYKRHWSDIDQHFNGLHMNVAMYHGIPYRVRLPDLKGAEFAFVPQKPGVYLLLARWSVKGEVGVGITGPPVVLTVRPKPPAK